MEEEQSKSPDSRSQPKDTDQRLLANRLATTVNNFLPRVASAIRHRSLRELLIYVHVPFCNYKCTFCDWVANIPVKQLKSDESIRERYVNALCRQIAVLGPALKAMGYRSPYMYWGGGTPSRFEAKEFEQVVSALHQYFDPSDVVEHTVETTPETLTLPKLQALKDLGVTRISMGCQSFDNDTLRKFGRLHTVEQIYEGADLIRRAGFTAFNLDVMIGLPEQTLSEVERSVERLLELDPPHVTVYLYRQDARTVLDRQIKQGVKQAKSEEEKAQHEDLACGLLERAGYSQYTTSYYAKGSSDFFQCEDYYFAFQGDSLGLGSGAASILGCHSLYNDPRNLHRFLEDPLRFDIHYKFQPFLPIDNLPFVQEALLTRTGLNFEAFRQLYGFEFADATNHRAFRAFLVALKRIGACVRRTPEGIRVSRSAEHDDRPVSQQMFLAARNSPAVVEESESIFDF